MRIPVSKLRANPYRKMKTYPVDKEKVARLKVSITETSFWDNVLARKYPGKPGYFQIAYGHHRLVALQELGVKAVDIPVKDIDDATMVRIMANENLEWNTSPTVVNQTVCVAKEFLDNELTKYKSLEDAKGCMILYNLFQGVKNKGSSDKIKNPNMLFSQVKNTGAGWSTIKRFLGDNWSYGLVQQALETLSGRKINPTTKEYVEIDRKAVEKLPTMRHAREFKKAVVDYNVPKEKQQKLAKQIKDKDISSRDIRKAVRKATKQTPKVDPEVKKVEVKFEDIEERAKSLTTMLKLFRSDLKNLGVTQLAGVKAFFGFYNIALLYKEIQELQTFATGKKLIEGETK
jgi:Cu/Ag efflux protein CusF